MKIYVATLGAYNSGYHHGAWIDLSGLDHDSLMEKIQEILQTSPEANEEEWAIHDFESDGINIKEYHDLEELILIQEYIDEHDEEQAAVVWGVKEYLGNTFEEAVNYYDENYIGEFESLEKFGEHFVDNGTIDVPDELLRYFDFEAYGRDVAFDCFEVNNHYFWSR